MRDPSGPSADALDLAAGFPAASREDSVRAGDLTPVLGAHRLLDALGG